MSVLRPSQISEPHRSLGRANQRIAMNQLHTVRMCRNAWV